jgi:hypothetical protein
VVSTLQGLALEVWANEAAVMGELTAVHDGNVVGTVTVDKFSHPYSH